MRNAKRYNSKGFTLAELLVALMVSSIVLSAVATLAYALSTVNDTTDDTAVKQAELRYATLRISELIRNCKLVCAASASEVVVWRADDNGNDQINASELVYIEIGSNPQSIKFVEFPSSSPAADFMLDIVDTQSSAVKASLAANYGENETVLISECSNAAVSVDLAAPWTRYLTYSFDIEENGVSSTYQINTSLRGWSGHLLSTNGDLIVSDDD